MDKAEDEVIIDIEMQNSIQYFMEKRATFYGSHIYSSQLKKHGAYNTLKKCIIIAILNFELYDNDNNYHHIEKIFNELKIHFI